MGVSRLWEILQPVSQNCPLTSLKGKTLAVDLSGWVCESSCLKGVSARKLYLRNLFFRVSCLLRAGVKLVFVTEGMPPNLKDEVLSQRALSQYGSTKVSDGGTTSKPSRKKFDFILRECKEMLESLGVACIQSMGEAEAMCAYLNMNKVVDGCISDDGDCFLYGGTVVYRNFTMETKDPHVEMYRLEDIEEQLKLNRKKLVALALLIGCDYHQKGLPGIGKELALQLLERLEVLNVDPLQRFEDWKTDETFLSLQSSNLCSIKKSSHCNNCQHPGTKKGHEKNGCAVCQTESSCSLSNSTDCSCEWHKKERLKEEWGVELKVLEKALIVNDFPNQQVVNEFLMYEDKLPDRVLEWEKPNVDLFKHFMAKHLWWTDEYSQQKFYPLLSMWQLTHPLRDGTTLFAIRILKTRIYKAISSFEVEWKTQSGELLPIVEPKDLVQAAYPDLVKQFSEEQKKKKKSKAKHNAKKPYSRNNDDSDTNKSITKVSSGIEMCNRDSLLQEILENLNAKPLAMGVEEKLSPKELLHNGAKKNARMKDTMLARSRIGWKPFKEKNEVSHHGQPKNVSINDSDDDFLPLTQRIAQSRHVVATKSVKPNVNRLQNRIKERVYHPTQRSSNVCEDGDDSIIPTTQKRLLSSHKRQDQTQRNENVHITLQTSSRSGSHGFTSLTSKHETLSKISQVNASPFTTKLKGTVPLSYEKPGLRSGFNSSIEKRSQSRHVGSVGKENAYPSQTKNKPNILPKTSLRKEILLSKGSLQSKEKLATPSFNLPGHVQRLAQMKHIINPHFSIEQQENHSLGSLASENKIVLHKGPNDKSEGHHKTEIPIRQADPSKVTLALNTCNVKNCTETKICAENRAQPKRNISEDTNAGTFRKAFQFKTKVFKTFEPQLDGEHNKCQCEKNGSFRKLEIDHVSEKMTTLSIEDEGYHSTYAGISNLTKELDNIRLSELPVNFHTDFQLCAEKISQDESVLPLPERSSLKSNSNYECPCTLSSDMLPSHEVEEFSDGEYSDNENSKDLFPDLSTLETEVHSSLVFQKPKEYPHSACEPWQVIYISSDDEAC